MVKYELKTFKSIINKLKYIDSWFWCRYTINSYNGCEHACIYCDARSKKYYLHPNFEQIVYVKANIREMLNMRLKKARKLLPDVVAFGGTCDAYQPAEKKYQNSKTILKILLKYNFPVTLSTKSSLVLRDIELFSKIATNTWSTIAFTITSFDKKVVDFLEPRASPPEERIKAISIIKEKHPEIQVGVNFMPIVPFFEDSNENLKEVIEKAKEANSDFILFSPGMTLRDDQAKFFLKKVKEKDAEIYNKFLELYGGNTYPNGTYILSMNIKIRDLCKKYKLPYRAKRWIPNDYRKINYKISELLLNESYELQIVGREYKQLLWAGLKIQNLPDSIRNIKDFQRVLQISDKISEKISEKLKKIKSKKNLTSYF
ncbi:MAG: radical SAM protein [Candidatus Helarchaeota archaeon]